MGDSLSPPFSPGCKLTAAVVALPHLLAYVSLWLRRSLALS